MHKKLASEVSTVHIMKFSKIDRMKCKRHLRCSSMLVVGWLDWIYPGHGRYRTPYGANIELRIFVDK